MYRRWQIHAPDPPSLCHPFYYVFCIGLGICGRSTSESDQAMAPAVKALARAIFPPFAWQYQNRSSRCNPPELLETSPAASRSKHYAALFNQLIYTSYIDQNKLHTPRYFVFMHIPPTQHRRECPSCFRRIEYHPKH